MQLSNQLNSSVAENIKLDSQPPIPESTTPVLDTHQELNTQESSELSENLIEVKGISKKYGEKFALKEVSISIKEGETVALIGPNGAGKTTLIESLLNLCIPDSGEIDIFGINILKETKAYLQYIGAHLQETRLFPKVSPRSYLEFYSSIYENTMNIDEIVSWLELNDFMDEKIGSLSGGMRQRVSLALAVINDPKLIMLDEPTVGLDPIARQEFWGLIKKLQKDNKTILFSTHYMDEATQLADKIIMIHMGEVVFCGPPCEVVNKSIELNGSLDLAYTYFVENCSGKK